MLLRLLLLLLLVTAPALRPEAENLPDAPSTAMLLAGESGEAFIEPTLSLSTARFIEPGLAAKPPKVIDRNFLLFGALVFGLTVVDVEMTQACIRANKCVELNPTLPKSHVGQYAINTAVNMGVMYLAYQRKKNGKSDWWIAPMIDIGAHGVGIASNIRVRFK